MFALFNYTGPGQDEAFQSVCVRRYNEAPLGLFVFWVGHIWTDCFGFTLLNLRVLVSVESILAVAITTFYLYSQTNNIRLSGIVFLLGCVLLRASGFHFYGWDAGLYIFCSISLCLFMSIISEPDLKKALLFGFFTGIMTLGRTPSGIFLPISIILVIKSLKQYDKFGVKYKIPLMIMAGWITAVILFTTVILGAPLTYFQEFINGNIISGHSPFNDSGRLWMNFNIMMESLPKVCFTGIVAFLLAILLPKLKQRFVIITLIVVWVAYCSLTSYWVSREQIQINILNGFDMPIGIVFLLTLFLYNHFEKRIECGHKIFLKLWGCGWLIFSMAFGSDFFFQRCVSAFVIPVIISILWNLSSNPLRTFLKYSIIILTLTYSSMLYVHILTIKTRYPNLVESNVPVLAGLKMNESVKKRLEDTYNVISAVRHQGVPYVFAGDHRFSEMLAGADEGVSFHQFHANISECEDWDNYRDTAINKVDAVIVSPGDMSRFNKNLFNDLKKEGFSESARYENLILFKRDVRKNPDKQYEIIE